MVDDTHQGVTLKFVLWPSEGGGREREKGGGGRGKGVRERGRVNIKL